MAINRSTRADQVHHELASLAKQELAEIANKVIATYNKHDRDEPEEIALEAICETFEWVLKWADELPLTRLQGVMQDAAQNGI